MCILRKETNFFFKARSKGPTRTRSIPGPPPEPSSLVLTNQRPLWHRGSPSSLGGCGRLQTCKAAPSGLCVCACVSWGRVCVWHVWHACVSCDGNLCRACLRVCVWVCVGSQWAPCSLYPLPTPKPHQEPHRVTCDLRGDPEQVRQAPGPGPLSR